MKYLLEFILVLFAGTLFIRLIVQYVVWPHIFGNEIRSLSFTNLLARHLYSLFDLIPIALAAVAIKLVQLRISALKQETMLVHEKVKSELQYLKAQTNPHFLFNTLNGIYALSRKQDVNTPTAIMNLSKILRYMLYETSQRMNPIRDELALITDYIALQKLRFQDHLTITLTKDLDDENAGISPLLERLWSLQSEKGSFHFFNVDKRQVKVYFDDMLYIESLKEYVKIHTTQQYLVTKLQIGEFETLLASPRLLRVRKSYIINLDKVTAYSANLIEIGSHQIPIGRTYKKLIMKYLKL